MIIYGYEVDTKEMNVNTLVRQKGEPYMLFNVDNQKLGCFTAGIPVAGCFELGW